MNHYAKFLRVMKCGSDPYPGEGPVCEYNVTHYGTCTPDCLEGLDHEGEYCGCSSRQGFPCPDSPNHVRCCLNTCARSSKVARGSHSNAERTTPEPCSELVTVAPNSTITGEVGKDKYKFFKIKVTLVGNQILITVTLLNGNVQLFFSFSNRNPQETQWANQTTISTTTVRSFTRGRKILLSIDLPATKPDFVFVGVKGVDNANQFEVEHNGYPLNSLSPVPAKLNIMLLLLVFASFTVNIHF